jgi:hypothetical protein
LLTQAYGECGTELDTRIARAVRLAIRCSSESQHGNGGFGYFIRRVIPEGNVMFTGDEASTTISQIQALRGARNAGFEVPARMLARAGDYISESQHAPTGGFVYSLQTGQVSFAKDSDTPTFAISAASACVLNALGKYRGPKLERALTYIETFEPPTNRATYFFYYGHYYAAQVMRQVGGARGKRWRRAILEELTRRQESDGSFPKTSDSHVAGEDGTILNTAWALQIMTMDGGVLPIFER